jgi:hypothetical protein
MDSFSATQTFPAKPPEPHNSQFQSNLSSSEKSFMILKSLHRKIASLASHASSFDGMGFSLWCSEFGGMHRLHHRCQPPSGRWSVASCALLRDFDAHRALTACPRLPPNARFGGMATYARKILTSPRDCHGGGGDAELSPMANCQTVAAACALFSRGDAGDIRCHPHPLLAGGSYQFRRGVCRLYPRSPREGKTNGN